jgi:DNA-binding Lrp family transcriptional regulator
MKQHDLFEITDYKQARALAHDLRMKIIDIYHDHHPRTAKQIADVLQLPAPKVHYHVRELVKTGLLFLTDTKENAGILEKYYLPIAKDFRIRLNELEGKEGDNGNSKLTILRKSINDFRDQYLQSLKNQESGEGEEQLFFLGNLSLNRQEAETLTKELMEVIQIWQKKKREENTPDGRRYGIVLSLFTKNTERGKSS